MKIAYLIKKNSLVQNPLVTSLLDSLRSHGVDIYDVRTSLQAGTDLLLSFGGDGTFLSAASEVCEQGVPVLGINLGRLGFLSENDVHDVLTPILEQSYDIQERSMLQVHFPGGQVPENFFPMRLMKRSSDVRAPARSLLTLLWTERLFLLTGRTGCLFPQVPEARPIL